MQHHSKKLIAGLLTAAVLIPAPVSLITPQPAAASELLGETTFDYKIVPWHTVQTSPARQEFNIDEGAAHIRILNPAGDDRSQWDLQFRHRGLNFKASHEYKVSFKVRAQRQGMELASHIGNLADSERYFVLDGQSAGMCMGPDMGGMWGNVLKLTTEYQEISGIFKPTADIEGAEWTFRYAYDTNGYGGNANSGDELWFDDMSIEDLTDPDYTPPESSYGYTSRRYTGIPNNFISVNQLGYYPKLAKIAALGDNRGDFVHGAESIALTRAYDYEIIDTATGNVVFTGTTGEPFFDQASGDTVCKIDFSDFDRPGEYFIRIKDYDWRSARFRIGTDIYQETDHNLLTNALNDFYQNRAGTDILGAYITSGDKRALEHGKNPYEGLGLVQSQWAPYALTTVSDAERYESSRIDTYGGWYTDDTYDKDMTTGGIALWTLQNLYERASLNEKTKEKFADGSGIAAVPETDNGVPDILDECRYELDFMAKMKVPANEPTWGDYAGMYYHKLTGLGFYANQPAYDHEYHAVFAVQPPTFAATLNYAACAAQGARLWAPYDADYAKKLLQNAKDAYQAYRLNWYQAKSDESRNEKSLYAPELFPDTDFEVEDEAYWAACELFLSARAMKDPDAEMYLNHLSDYRLAYKVTLRITSGQNAVDPYGNGSYTMLSRCNPGSAGSLSLLLHKDQLADKAAEALEKSLLEAANDYLYTEAKQGYGIPYQYDGSGYQDEYSGLPGPVYWGYEQYSNERALNNLIAMAYAYDLTGDASYLNGVSAGMDYLLGNNPMAYSFITGCGDYCVQNPAHRYWQQELDPTLPAAPDGVAVSGPSAVITDSYMRALGIQPGKIGAPSQRYYADSVESWASNCTALSTNASLAWVVSFMQDEAPNLTVEPVKPGDVNGDGTVDENDAAMLRDYLLGDSPVKIPKAADMDGNGKLTAADLTLLKRNLVNVVF